MLIPDKLNTERSTVVMLIPDKLNTERSPNKSTEDTADGLIKQRLELEKFIKQLEDENRYIY
jgi:hypothetical protein